MAPAPPLSSRPLCCGRGHRLCQAGHGHCPGHWPTACAGGGDGRGQGPWCCPQVSASCPMLARSRWPQTHALLGASGQAPCGVRGGRKVLAQRQQVLGKQSRGPALRGSEPLLLSDQAAGGTPPPPPRAGHSPHVTTREKLRTVTGTSAAACHAEEWASFWGGFGQRIPRASDVPTGQDRDQVGCGGAGEMAGGDAGWVWRARCSG